VQYYREGTLSFADRKKLLNRARLLVSTHENLLADMVFMPPVSPLSFVTISNRAPSLYPTVHYWFHPGAVIKE